MPKPSTSKRRARLRGWSYSTHKTEKQCPRKVAYGKIDKLPDPSGPAAERGEHIHNQLEDYVNSSGSSFFPPVAKKFKPEIDAMIGRGKVVAEMQIAIDRNWNPVSWKRAKCRGKLDLVEELPRDVIKCVDYKTGRIYEEDHKEQLELYATFLFHKYEWLETVKAECWYIDQEGEVLASKFSRKQFPALLRKWQARGEALLGQTHWPAKRNRFCKWCAFNSKNDGPCIEGA